MARPSLHVVPAPAGNQILAALPPDEEALLQPHLEQVALSVRQDLYGENERIEHVYFLDRGVASILNLMPDGPPVEIATVGPEGMVGLPILLGAERMPNKAFIQIPGDGVRVEAGVFRKLIARSPTLNHLLLRYTQALMVQMAQNSACNRSHDVEERCARWLLMTQDRVHEATFPLTQEFLAQMLGVRRPTVSMAAGMLARAGLISYIRGRMTILDRHGLEGASCECYGVIRREHERLVRAVDS